MACVVVVRCCCCRCCCLVLLIVVVGVLSVVDRVSLWCCSLLLLFADVVRCWCLLLLVFANAVDVASL